MPRCVYIEDWWLDAATNGTWDAVSIERDGQVQAWLPYAVTRNTARFSQIGLPPLTRLLFPVVNVPASKAESANRTRFSLECDLIDQLPRAASYQFVLPPDHGNALAWQAKGFDARIQHTFVVDPGSDTDALWMRLRNKERNAIRRAEEGLRVGTLTSGEFAQLYRQNVDEIVTVDEEAAVQRIVEAAVAHGQGRIVAALDEQQRVQAAVAFVWDHQDYYYYLSTRDRDHAASGAVAMLVWAGMKDAAERGLRFDFDGVSSESRLRFLQAFGGDLASRIVVSRGSPLFETRMQLRRFRAQWKAGGPVERFY